MDPNKAELLAGCGGIAVFFLTLFTFAWPLWLSLTLTALCYVGLNLTLGGLFEDKVQQIVGGRQSAINQLHGQIDRDRQAVKNLRRLARSIQNEAIREKISQVCDLSEKIFHNFQEDPDDIRRAHRFLSHFNKLLPIIENYVHLSSDADRREVLTRQDEASIELTLDEFRSNLKAAYQAFQENNLQQLRVATGTLKRMIEMDNTGKRRQGGAK
mgnify:CR=1 FL=1